MSSDDASKRDQILIDMVREYESGGLDGKSKDERAWQDCDENDREWLSIIMTLEDIGFTHEEMKTYMRLLAQGMTTATERLRMLNEKRRAALAEIHAKERQIDRLDYLRFALQKQQ